MTGSLLLCPLMFSCAIITIIKKMRQLNIIAKALFQDANILIKGNVPSNGSTITNIISAKE